MSALCHLGLLDVPRVGDSQKPPRRHTASKKNVLRYLSRGFSKPIFNPFDKGLANGDIAQGAGGRKLSANFAKSLGAIPLEWAENPDLYPNGSTPKQSYLSFSPAPDPKLAISPLLFHLPQPFD
ncbi:hypothetical protein ACLOJK_019143 [Asimina triloba]